MAELVWEGKYRDGKRVAPARIELSFGPFGTVRARAKDRTRIQTRSPARGRAHV